MLLLIGYLLLFALQITLLVFALKRQSKRYWYLLYAIEAGSAVGALILMMYYDKLPGHGMAPGLAYFAETFYSLFAAAGFGVMLVISVLAGIIASVLAERKKR